MLCCILEFGKEKRLVFFLPTEITEEKEFKRLFASYFAGKENVGEALDAARNFASSVNSLSLIYDRRNQMLEEIECRFFAKFVKAFRRYIDVAKIPEDLREVVRDTLLSIRKRGSTLTSCGTAEVSAGELKEVIKNHYSLKQKAILPQEINRLASCLENSGLVIKFENFILSYIFPAPCLSDEILDSIARPYQSAEPIDRLNSLRMEVKKLENKVERGVVDDLNEAINEFEFGHLLAGSLIASRVIRYIFDKIPGKEENEEKRVEAKLNELIKRGIVEKDRKDEQKNFIWASKKARDILSHVAGLSPKPEEAHRLLASAVTFAKYYAVLTENSSKKV